MQFSHIVIIYLVLINLAAFVLMGLDKRKARKNLWRIPEKTLFLSAILGGSAGAIAGMYVFHHKTRHWYFVIGMPLILVIQIGLGIWLIYLR
ncbi:DUF1294 domain-containing protein [Lachnoclostridium sp. An196]|uniref:DUF1294 domain-containing protein n=1 Tax=Lachnoclostridium sp. An196 TaxID=1965583 RepID=UPI0023BA30A4|nr:DUF1294 domain-containing protein [Lachnoclostridium sp. An196]